MDTLEEIKIIAYGIIRLPLVPGRSEPSDKAEMVSQFLFGALYTVLDQNEKWVRIKSERDQYACWIDKKQHSPVSDSEYQALSKSEAYIVKVPLGNIEGAQGITQVPMGSILRGLKANGNFQIGEESYIYLNKQSTSEECDIKTLSHSLRNAPYLWGGKSVLGIDCSGFVQVVYRAMGIELPRDAYQQAEKGRTVDFVNQAECGDLVFFDNDEGRITHVGIALNAEEIIHASGSVRIDKLDHHGIYHKEMGVYTHKSRIIKRVNPE